MTAATNPVQEMPDAPDRYSERCLAKMRFTLEWQSESVRHTEIRIVERLNAWRDMLPAALEAGLQGKGVGESAAIDFAPGELLAGRYDPARVLTIPIDGIDTGLYPQMYVAADFGRFYPQGIIHEKGHVHGIFKQSMRPLRILERVDDDRLKVDLNHPFARFKGQLQAEVEALEANEAEVGGRSTDWGLELCDGPGMQARHKGLPSEFLFDGALDRIDDSPDSIFYSVPRMVVHLDTAALGVIEKLHSRFLADGMRVLDLMSSMKTHIADAIRPAELVGLGLNEEELAANPRLTAHKVHDLNADLKLPFADETFDAVLCTSSVEYLLDPVGVATEVARVLKPGAPFVISFSHRWFPPKVIRVWREIHPFERIGYVLEALHRSGRFAELESWTLRGMARPGDDRHVSEDGLADPVFAVWGRRR